MISREELIRSKEYWLEKIQNELFLEIEAYIKNNNLNKTQFAEKLGVSKSYLSQVLNGNFDHKLSKLIELSLAIGKVPTFNFEDIEDFLVKEKTKKTNKYDDKLKTSFGYTAQFSEEKTDYNK